MTVRGMVTTFQFIGMNAAYTSDLSIIRATETMQLLALDLGLAGDLSPIQFNQLKENHATQFR
jgi:hypothetical protein